MEQLHGWTLRTRTTGTTGETTANPLGVDPNEASDEQEKNFIDNIKDNVPDRWDIEIEEE